MSASVGFGLGLQQRRRGHDHAALAEAALRHVERDPGLLHRVRAVRRQAFDGDDLLARPRRVETGRTQRARRHAVDVHRAGAALRDAAAVLGAGQAELLAQHPQQRRVGLGLELAHRAVDVQSLPYVVSQVDLYSPACRPRWCGPRFIAYRPSSSVGPVLTPPEPPTTGTSSRPRRTRARWRRGSRSLVVHEAVAGVVDHRCGGRRPSPRAARRSPRLPPWRAGWPCGRSWACRGAP